MFVDAIGMDNTCVDARYLYMFQFSLPVRIYMLAPVFDIISRFSSLQLVLLNRTLAERGLATWVDSF